MPDRYRHRVITRLGDAAQIADVVAIEQPLAIHVAAADTASPSTTIGTPLVVTLRSPGDDEALVTGWLYSEGIITSTDELAHLTHCGHSVEPDDTMLAVVTIPSAQLAAIQPRQSMMHSGCGVCSLNERAVFDQRLAAITADVTSNTRTLSIPQLRATIRQTVTQQPLFRATGGVHAAVLYDDAMSVIAAHEDVGRHNAVDKVIGAAITTRRLGEAQLLWVSGRAGFELVHKAAMARIAVMVAVGAPTDLAITTAERCGMTLIAFAKGEQANVYSHAWRLQ